MKTNKTRKAWEEEEMISLFLLIETKGDSGFIEFIKTHPWRTESAAKSRYKLIKSGKINLNDSCEKIAQKITFNTISRKPIKRGFFNKLYNLIKSIFTKR